MNVENLLELRDRLNELISRYTTRIGDVSLRSGECSHSVKPPMDMYNEGNRQIIYLEAPDLCPDSVRIERKDSMVLFSADKREIEERARDYLHMERRLGRYYRPMPLIHPERVIDRIDHLYKFGVVRIEVVYEVNDEN